MSKDKKDKFYETVKVLENKTNSNWDIETFQNVVKFLKKLPKEHLQLAVGQVGNFTKLANKYMSTLNQSLNKNHQLVSDYQDTLLDLLKKDDNSEVRMQILKDLKDLQKSVDRQIMIDKFHLDKVAAGAMTIIGAVALGIMNNKEK